VNFDVNSVHEGFAEAIRWHLAPFVRTRPDVNAMRIQLREDDEDRRRGRYRVSMDNVLKAEQYEEAMDDLLLVALWNIWRGFSSATRDFLLMHSGAVARDGSAILMPAPMQSGKSSLTLALIREGFSYLSDEFAAIDPVTSRDYPVERPIALRSWNLERFQDLEEALVDRRDVPIRMNKRYIRPQDVEADVAGPSRVGWIVFPTNAFDGPPRLIPVSRSEAVEIMVGSCFNAPYYEERAVILLARIATDAPAFRIEGGSPGERAELIRDTLA
jgi:hypothetical protein